MQVDDFFKHWHIQEHPFRAEEARDDPVLSRLMEEGLAHPDFDKICGQPGRPSASVVFGEKGSGKTSLRLLLERHYGRHNLSVEAGRVWIARYDDLNGVLDRLAHHKGSVAQGRDDRLLESLRLDDHQDAILSQVVTELIDGLLGYRQPAEAPEHPMPNRPDRAVRRMPHAIREDLAVLAAIYDQPRAGDVGRRMSRLRRLLRLRWIRPMELAKWSGLAAMLMGAVLTIVGFFREPEDGMTVIAGVCAATAILLLGWWMFAWLGLWRITHRIRRDVRVVDRTSQQLFQTLSLLRRRDLASQPLPAHGDQDTRYQLTSRLLGVLDRLGYSGIVVLIDRIDEPVRVNGDPMRMRSIVWPMLNNKFLQQAGVGVKMLLPIELRHLLQKENSDFYQRARLDKQHMIDRLAWSGVSLYDLCTARLRACMEPSSPAIALIDLFDADVTRQELTDALEHMHQPRDAFKFLYQLIQEHCQSVTRDEPVWKIPRLILQQVRKTQAQRVQELHRGVAPA